MEVTTLSTKGQIVISEKLRQGFEPGDSFVVTEVEKIIVLLGLRGFSHFMGSQTSS